MAKLNMKYRIEVDNKEMIKKFHKTHREVEEFDYAIRNLLKDIKVGIRIVPEKEKEWWQIWK
jgi:hypothetical protein